MLEFRLELNEQKTKDNAKENIKSFLTAHRIAYGVFHVPISDEWLLEANGIDDICKNPFYIAFHGRVSKDVQEYKRIAHKVCNSFIERFNRLPVIDREILYRAYIALDSHVKVAYDMHMSESQLSANKLKALYNLAFVLCCEELAIR